MSNFYDRYITRTIGDCKTVKEHNLKELKDDFEEVLNDALTSDEYLYTKVNEIPDLNSTRSELLVISNVTNNDKTELEEKYFLCLVNLVLVPGTALSVMGLLPINTFLFASYSLIYFMSEIPLAYIVKFAIETGILYFSPSTFNFNITLHILIVNFL